MATDYTQPLPPGMTAEELDEKFAETKSIADKAWMDTMRSYTPVELQKYLPDYAEGAQPPGGGEGGATVVAGQEVRVVSQMGGDVPGSPGTAAVVAGNLDFVQLATPAKAR